MGHFCAYTASMAFHQVLLQSTQFIGRNITVAQAAESCRDAIQKETKYAAQVPMEVARTVHSILPMIDVVARKGNSNAVTDACVSMMCARTAILGALLNVRINLTSIKDEKFVKEMSEEADMIEQTTIAEEQKILDYVKTIF